MGISFSCPFANFSDLSSRLETILATSLSLKEDDVRTVLRSVNFNSLDSEPTITKPIGCKRMVVEESLSLKDKELETALSFKSCASDGTPRAAVETPVTPMTPVDKERYQAALRLQKTYKSFRTRRQLADCAVLVEQRWWKLLDFAVLKQSSVSFFEIEKPETAMSRWARARTRAAKVGKGLSKDEKARKLALQHWLEAIDPRHRYGHNLQFYYAKWLICQSRQPFFYWLDIGEGKEVNLERCSRIKLLQQCIKYLGPAEREAYEVEVEGGKFMYKQSGQLIDTREGPPDAKWIFVLSTSRILYIAQKKKGTFQHSSFLAGGATLSAGRLVLELGILKAVWPHSGHYLPTEENFEAFMSFLEEHNVDLSTVKKSPEDGEEDVPLQKSDGLRLRTSISVPDFSRAGEVTKEKKSHKQKSISRKEYSKDTINIGRPPLSRWSRGLESKITTLEIPKRENIFKMFAMQVQNNDHCMSSSDGYETAEEFLSDIEFMVSKRSLFDADEYQEYEEPPVPKEKIMQRINSHKGMKSYQLAQQLSCKWSTGAGPRIGCVRDYPSELQFRVLEEVALSPRRHRCPSPRVSIFGKDTTPRKSPLSSEHLASQS